MSPLEVAYGLVLGQTAEPAWPVVTGRRGDHTVVARALDAVIGAALERAPCLVSFSGGRDSSALLAWATRLARRHGYDLPVPATLFIPGDSDADEQAWQDHVLSHLGLTDRLIFSISDELDAVGPVAGTALHRHGLLWPFNTHMHLPIIAAAQGGSVITGFGGDELGRSSEFARSAQVLSRRKKPMASDVKVLGLALSPDVVRRRVFRHRTRGLLEAMPWLTPSAVAALTRAVAEDDVTVPIGWATTLREWFRQQRYFQICQQSFAVVGRSYDVDVVHPFVAPDVLGALAAVGGFGGLGSRASLMQFLFADVLPAEIIQRRSKASFSNVLWTDTSREFARQWSGGGVDSQYVDVGALRAHWSSGTADMRSLALLQSAWLFDHPAPDR
ncbi:asparagine synthase-related protein [Jatrophihabitans telluris]|uniref:Asparagine synthase-related protein n=1 Tax=Jatrophihabitans telluris TaxID=2038343 RepID=A0ABY4QWF7_9ACTN|nr:asparagine synthase-related protein [Jatrophihabitans telluris]UQX87875.1 asparagine synthase-related protein [Jatrophihabitans telluris]